MIALYSLTASPEETRAHFAYADEAWFPPRAHVAAGEPVGIVRSDRGERRFVLVRWGFVPGWAKEFPAGRGMATARVESVLHRPAFRHAIGRRRCLVPANGFYAWGFNAEGRKQPFHLRLEKGGVFGIAGIHEHWMGADGSEVETAAILTLASDAGLADYGRRMPAVVNAKDYAGWLDAEAISATEAIGLVAALDRFVAEPTGFAPRRKRSAASGKEADQPPLF